MIDLTVHPEAQEKNIAFCRDKGIVLPTFSMMKDPQTIPGSMKKRLETIGLWDLDPANLFRITWKNEPRESGGLFDSPNYILLPPELTGCRAGIIMMCGKWFPTGAHKVGAAYSCLAPGLVTGQFDPGSTRAVWPSTGNYCRGGAYISALLACRAIAILPEEMSRERFEWLSRVAGEVIATPGCESNVKEIFDKCRELKDSGQDLKIFNQFDEPGNPLWHYSVTGSAAREILDTCLTPGKRFAGFIAASGSGGTLGAGYYLKKKYPGSKLAVAEALQCPTLLNNGFGGHRIEGIGDKHVPWIHDCKDTDFIIAVDDELPMRLIRLFNEETGKKILVDRGVDPDLISDLGLLGISGIANMVGAVKFAKYNELTEDDLIISIATDSMALYGSRLLELAKEKGPYLEIHAHQDMQLLDSVAMDQMKELSYYDKKAIHNLKYYTWVEQQGRDVHELDRQWIDHDQYWGSIFEREKDIDDLIMDFNHRVGIL
ncbi:pyridoxal-phosphate dependent enzyme [Desulfospira joergensenii]|uniref:pyridoxal-phosphate dependent enzyme n=1 Tax=Desulfospira joergensenii TaxID=53329 RepID=UPI0003B73C9B|nr:pyridoxal-phosphate dependent enzyme [Desulfospira joergensenii]